MFGIGHFAVAGTTLKTLGAKAEEVKAPEKTVSESVSTSDIDGKKTGTVFSPEVVKKHRGFKRFDFNLVIIIN